MDDRRLIETHARWECMKLASANADTYAPADVVVERAEKYADFVLGEMGMDTASERQAKEDWAEEAFADYVPGFDDAFGDVFDDCSLDFGGALDALKDDQKVAREGWNGKDMWLELQVPDERSKMSLDYIYMKTAQGDLVPWLASQIDLLAEDWYLV